MDEKEFSKRSEYILLELFGVIFAVLLSVVPRLSLFCICRRLWSHLGPDVIKSEEENGGGRGEERISNLLRLRVNQEVVNCFQAKKKLEPELNCRMTQRKPYKLRSIRQPSSERSPKGEFEANEISWILNVGLKVTNV